MKKSVEYLTSLYREFGDNAQKALDFIEKNVNENNEGTGSCGSSIAKIIEVPVPTFYTGEKVSIYDYYKKEFVTKEDVDNHDKNNLEVIMVHQNGAFIVSKRDTEEFSLETEDVTGNYISEECKALFDFDGKKNTELLVKAGLDIELPEGYYIPSLGEFVVMRRNIEEVNECLKLVGGDELNMDSGYWSSTEGYRGSAWGVNFSSGSVGNGGKSCQFVARAVAAFTYDV